MRFDLLKTNLNGRVAIVTGSARGMGETIAKILAANGSIVAVNDVDSLGAEKVAREIREAGGKALAIPSDISKYDEAFRLADHVREHFGHIDILVNNAGIIRGTSVEDMNEEEWDRMIEVNIKGVFNCSKAVLKSMKEKRYGKIVNLSSTAGKTTSTFGGPHYTTSKAAVLGFTRHLARELAPYGINVNAVCPGIIDTPMVRSMATPEKLVQIAKNIPMQKLGKPEDVAYLALFLVSDASSYITGASIDIDAGELIL
jgi:3-oxoacyl-[acyl-carrier protein] reductase